MRLIVDGVLFAVFTVGMFVGLPLWCFHRIWLPWTADIIDEAVHGERKDGADNG